MTHLLEVVERIASFEGLSSDLKLMETVGQTMQTGSLCGHGQLGFNPIKSALAYFEPDFRAHIEEKRCLSGQCPMPRLTPKNMRPFADEHRRKAEEVVAPVSISPP